MDLGRRFEQVPSPFLDHIEGNDRIPIEASKAFPILIAINDLGNVVQMDHTAPFILHHDPTHLAHFIELTLDPDAPLVLPQGDIARPDRDVLPFHGALDILEAHLPVLHLMEIGLDPDLPLKIPLDLHFIDLRHAFDPILKLLRIALEVGEALIPGEIDVEDGEATEIDFPDARILIEIVREFLLGLIHRIAYLDQGILHFHVGIELDHDSREPLRRGRIELLDPFDVLDLLFQRPRDQVLHIRRGVPGVAGAHVDRGDLDVGEQLLGQGDVRTDPHQDDQDPEEEGTGTVPKGQVRQSERAPFVALFNILFLHRSRFSVFDAIASSPSSSRTGIPSLRSPWPAITTRSP